MHQGTDKFHRGRISFTTDVWSNANLASYLALTAHWISLDEAKGRLELRTALIGFHRLKTRHTGQNLAEAILELLDRANVTLKVHFSNVYLLAWLTF